MPKILNINNAEQIKEQIKKKFSSEKDVRFIRKLDILLLICEGYSIPYVAKIFGYKDTTIQRWIHRVNTSGIQGLKERPGRGRPASLSDKDREKLKQDLEKDPSHFGYEQARWDGKLLSHHLEKHYNVKLKVRRCQNLFKELGFSLQRPRKVPDKGDKEAQEDFKKNSKKNFSSTRK